MRFLLDRDYRLLERLDRFYVGAWAASRGGSTTIWAGTVLSDHLPVSMNISFGDPTAPRRGTRIPDKILLDQDLLTQLQGIWSTDMLHYGVCVSDVDGDGKMEFFVCGFGSENQVLKWTGQRLVNIARGTPLEDSERRAIGVAAGDLDGDGEEEIYVLNTDTFLGRKKLTDRLFSKSGGSWVDMFSLPMNMDEANMCAGRSVCAVDRMGTGRYGFFVANYGGMMKLFEISDSGFLEDRASEAGLATYPTGGRALVSLPLVSHHSMDIFAGNEGGPNFLFRHKGMDSGQYAECGADYGLMDSRENCRGIAVVDIVGTESFGLACGNWQGPHRLFVPSGPEPIGGAKALGFF
ncbi:hypothetical protein L7F22_043328 [Adiantum nelumboides]|nr:hypothetical protein [Adiantum nelumboides]